MDTKWKPGQSGNPKGRPKTLFKDDFDTLKAKAEMMKKGTQMLLEAWEEVVEAMITQAVKGNTQAATYLRDTFLGKPKETIETVEKGKEKVLSLAYAKRKDG